MKARKRYIYFVSYYKGNIIGGILIERFPVVITILNRELSIDDGPINRIEQIRQLETTLKRETDGFPIILNFQLLRIE